MTKQLRRTFSTEFKIDAASLVFDQGHSMPEAANSMSSMKQLYRDGSTNSKLSEVG